ncbi:MAG: Hpt domain-containing protein [Gammaproteobacteria bacterium]
MQDAPGPASDNVIDLSVLATLVGSDPARLHRFLAKFIDSTEAGLAELHACLARGDLARIRELGHRIKSAARVVGALGMGELCERLERIAPSAGTDGLADAEALAARLGPMLDHVRAVAAPLDPNAGPGAP